MEEIKKEIEERVTWAAEKIQDSNVTLAQIDRVNQGLYGALSPLLEGEMTESKKGRIRNLLQVYRFTVLELVR